MSTLAIKLVTILIRQITRPVANVIKGQAKQHTTFKSMCITLAQQMHRIDVILRSRITPSLYVKKIRPLNDEKAVENGATILSELFVFGVTGSVVVWETLRQRNKEISRREQVLRDIELLRSQIEELRERTNT